MKRAISFIAMLCIAITSCKKEPNAVIPPETVDSVYSVLPKQVISAYIGETNNGGDSLITNVISIKYDTANLKIEMYLDDTTNTNPFDELAQTYTYNKDGYLIGYAIFDNGNTSEKYAIKRGADNNIETIIYNDSEGEQIDTTFFTYQTSGTNTNVRTIMRSYQTAYNNVDTNNYSYDADFKLTKIQGTNSGDYFVANFVYNANNTLNKVVTADGGNNLPTSLNAEADFFYSPAVPDAKDDIVKKAFLGRDYYLYDLQMLYPFGFVTEFNLNNFYMVSFTDPYQVINTQYSWNSRVNKQNFTYSMNEHKLVSKVTWDGAGGPGHIIFKY